MIAESPTTAPAAIYVDRLSVGVGDGGRQKTLLREVSFAMPTGSFVAIVGTSGCGKSTLLKAVGGLLEASSGSVRFAGHEVGRLRAEFPLAIGYLPQYGAFHPELTVEENLRYALALRLPPSVAESVRENWLAHIVEIGGLGALRGQRYSTLSGGQMRRIALAELLVGDPAFLLLDELTSGLDEFSDREMMQWLRELSHRQGKTILLVTHATYHLGMSDAVLFLHRGRLVQFSPHAELLGSHQAESMADLLELYETDGLEWVPPLQETALPESIEVRPQRLQTAKPPSQWMQWWVLWQRQCRLFWRDRAQMYLHLSLVFTFPALVAVFAVRGLPQVRNLALSLESNIVKTLAEQLLYLRESFRASALISGLVMFQVILLTLVGANNGAREIAKEREILRKEIRAGLSPFAYVAVKFAFVLVLSVVQSFWMAWFVKTICGFPGPLGSQFGILFATTVAMSATCLAISAGASSAERASLLAIYLVGFQLPLSGAALALPDWISWICRPFIAAYWGWSGYLQTLAETRHYDVVRQATSTHIAAYRASILVLLAHATVAFLRAWWSVKQQSRLGEAVNV